MQLGTRVKIVSGMVEVVGRRGIIVDNIDRDGSTIMYRIALDKPANIPGFGDVLCLNGMVVDAGEIASVKVPRKGDVIGEVICGRRQMSPAFRR